MRSRRFECVHGSTGVSSVERCVAIIKPALCVFRIEFYCALVEAHGLDDIASARQRGQIARALRRRFAPLRGRALDFGEGLLVGIERLSKLGLRTEHISQIDQSARLLSHWVGAGADAGQRLLELRDTLLTLLNGVGLYVMLFTLYYLVSTCVWIGCL